MDLFKILGLGLFSLGLGLGCSNPVLALPEVESRTGAPVVYSGTGTGNTPSGTSTSVSHTVSQIETLRQEISELRGQLEVQDHEIKQLKKSQQDFYVDLDKRLSQLQNAHGGKSSPKPTTASNKGVQIIPKGKTAPSVSTVSTAVPKPPVVPAPAEIKTSASAMPVTPPSMPEVPSSLTQPISPTTAVTEKGCYDAAYALVKSKQYSEANLGFQEYLNQYPMGEYAANAHFWIGEIHMLQWQSDKTNMGLIDKASQEFMLITSQFPTNPKVTDALLKLGMIETEKGNIDLARQHLMDVKNRYPNSSAARIAETKLQAMQ